MRTRLKDIARHLNISPGLVSGVLNGRENVWASEDTRNRIYEAARRLNYSYTAPLKIESVASIGTIDLVYCRREALQRSALASIVDALSAAAEQHNLALIVRSFGDVAKGVAYLSVHSAGRSGPYVLWGEDQDVSLLGDALEAQGIPFLVFGRSEQSWVLGSQFDFNVEEMVMGAIDHVRVMGHRRIAYLGESGDSLAQRLMRDSFIKWNKACFGEDSPTQVIAVTGAGIEDYQAEIESLFELPEDRQPTAFVMAGSNLAWTALEACLMKRNLKLGFGRMDRIAAGIYERPLHLHFGAALGYDIGDTQPFFSSALLPLLSDWMEGSPGKQVKLFLPRLARIPTLHLGQSDNPQTALGGHR